MTSSGLRERKKQATRVALQNAALELTAERGLDRVTVDDIAEAADVSPRTFFNYFSCKEEAVVGVEPGALGRMTDVLAARPADEEPLLALRTVLGEIAAGLAVERDLQVMRRQVVADNPALLPRYVAAFVEFEQVLVDAVRRRGGDEGTTYADAALVVAAAVSALRVSVDAWITGPDDIDLPELFDRSVERLAVGLVSPSARRKAHSRTTKRQDL
jgi:AcrR family transcriptional regulator